MKYKVYQIPFPKDENNKKEINRFRRYAYAHLNWIDEVNLDNYEMTYEGEISINLISDENFLDQIFRQLNLNHPEDYKGHSLSVSDLLEVNGKFYYCDAYSWEEIDLINGVYHVKTNS